MQVYLAWWHETLVAVKLLVKTGAELADAEAITDQALSLSNPIMCNLQMVTMQMQMLVLVNYSSSLQGH